MTRNKAINLFIDIYGGIIVDIIFTDDNLRLTKLWKVFKHQLLVNNAITYEDYKGWEIPNKVELP